MPDTEKRQISQFRYDLVSKSEEKLGITEKHRDVYAQHPQQPVPGGAISKDTMLEIGDRIQPFGVHYPDQPTTQRRHGVLAEIKTIMLVDPFQQEVDLNILYRTRTYDRPSGCLKYERVIDPRDLVTRVD